RRERVRHCRTLEPSPALRATSPRGRGSDPDPLIFSVFKPKLFENKPYMKYRCIRISAKQGAVGCKKYCFPAQYFFCPVRSPSPRLLPRVSSTNTVWVVTTTRPKRATCLLRVSTSLIPAPEPA